MYSIVYIILCNNALSRKIHLALTITPLTPRGRPPLLGDHFLLDLRVVSQKRDYCSTETDSKTKSEKLLADVDLPSSQWVTQHQSEERVDICKLSSNKSPSTHSLAITHCISISSDLSWTLSVHGSKVNVESCGVLNTTTTPQAM